jgi:V8-like Glu-specific endopeptidase
MVCAVAALPVAAELLDSPFTQDAEPGRASGERAPGSFDRAAYAAELRAKAARLATTEVAAGLSAPVVVTATVEDLEAIAQGDLIERRYRVGISKPLEAELDLSGLVTGPRRAPADISFGAVRRGESGLVWSGRVSSPGAVSLRLHFTDFTLPDGAELWLYNRLGEAFGPYTSDGPDGDGAFWSHTLAGSDALLQLRVSADDLSIAGAYFVVDSLGFMSDRFAPGGNRLSANDLSKAFCSFNEDCVENAECGSNQAVSQARDAVAYMLFKSGRYWYICSGGLLADSDTSTQIPYFLTANHCISRGREADTLETTFFYTSPCNQTCDTSTTPSTLGAAIVATSRTSDYTLLQLNQSAPGGTAFLGWDSTPVADADGTSLYRISHPAGAPQAYSAHDVDTGKGTCTSWPRGNWIYSTDVFGATEGGSSGSPVVNADGKVVGQLSGGCGTDVYNTCNTVDNATVDGAFAAYFDQVAPWLAGGGQSCSDSDGDGYDDASCGGDDCDDTDFFVNPGQSEHCSDGLDNDCDGDIDGADTECATGCSPKDDICTEDADCCSNKCRGRTTKRCR